VTANASLPAGQQILVVFQDTGGYNINYMSFAAATSTPPAPTNLTATAGNTQVTLNWSASAGATSYNVYRGTSAGGESGTPVVTGLTSTTYTNTGLTNGTTYFFTVKAVNLAGMSPASNEASTTPQPSIPPAPTGLSATAGNTQVSLSWAGSSGATSYNVYRGATAGGEGSTAIATGITTTSYTNTGLTNGTAYFYKVAAVNSAGTSGLSNEASATPSGTTGVVSIACGNSAVGTFVADTDFSGGAVSSGTTNAIDTSAVTNPAPTSVYQHGRKGTCTYTIPGLTAGASYHVRLDFCEYAHTASGQRQFNVSINGTQVLTNFDIFAAAGAEFKANAQSFTATASSSGQIVIVFTTVLDNAIVQGIEITTGSGGTAPPAPTNLTATAGNTQVSLSWTASSGATSYNVYRGTTAGGEGTTAVATGLTGTTYTNTGLTNGTAYFFTVKAVNSVGTSGASNEASATPSGGGTAPAAPTNLAATAGTGQISLTWTASSGATSYNVYRGTSAGGEGTTAIGTSTSTSFTNTGTTDGTKYYYTVKAVNSVGTSGASNEASATSGAIVSGIDLIVTSVTWSPSPIAAGNHVVFTAVIKNQGQTATPSGTIVGCQFAVDGATSPITWSDTDTTSLGPGQSVTLTANNGTNNLNYWTAVSGSHSVQAWVDDVNRIAESNENNNKLVASFSVP
jgi:fibronectin type 3 domain-containing protein